jgi:hypothetical protein
MIFPGLGKAQSFPAPRLMIINLAVVILSGLILMGSEAGAQTPIAAGTGKAPAERVNHFAFLGTADSMKRSLNPVYWAVNQLIQECLTAYGYPDEAVYRFCEEGKAKAASVDGKATADNFKKTFAHLAKIMTKDDHLTIFIVGHGSPYYGDIIYPMCDRWITGVELKDMLAPLPSQNVTIIINTCHSGGFIGRLAGPGRVICTCTTFKENNSSGWFEHIGVALFPLGTKPSLTFPFVDYSKFKIDANDDGLVSIKEAYNAALLSGPKRYGANLREHPLLEDNADGRGHFGGDATVAGDGGLAARRFLGDEGRRLHFSAEAIENLKQINADLKLE